MISYSCLIAEGMGVVGTVMTNNGLELYLDKAGIQFKRTVGTTMLLTS